MTPASASVPRRYRAPSEHAAGLWPGGPLSVLLAMLALVAAACGVEVGQGSAAQRQATGRTPNGDVVGGDTGALATTTSTTPPATTAVPRSEVEINGDDGSKVNRTVANAIADLQDWWGTELPKAYDKVYEPVSGGFYAVDRSSVSSSLPCAPDDASQVLENAYYCPQDDAVVWDQESLMPRLAREFGDFTPAVVLAHEWGHAIQARVRFRGPTVIAEQQADCFAGAWVRHVRDDGDRFQVSTNDVDNALAGFLSLRDAPGSRADDPNAHGSGFDRVRAFQEGFEDGVDRCSQYHDGDPEVFQFPFDPAEVNPTGDLPLHTAGNDPGILESVFTSLDKYWTKEFPGLASGKAWDPLKDPVSFTENDPPTCGGEKVTAFDLFVCRPDRYVGYVEDPMLRDVYNQGGDFAVATLIATKYGIDAEAQLGDLPSPVTSGLRGDCYAGSWAASILPGRVDTNDPDAISLSPGDLDEAVGVLLSFRSHKDRVDEGPGFDRVRAFRIGVISGPESCTKVKPT